MSSTPDDPKEADDQGAGAAQHSPHCSHENLSRPNHDLSLAVNIASCSIRTGSSQSAAASSEGVACRPTSNDETRRLNGPASHEIEVDIENDASHQRLSNFSTSQVSMTSASIVQTIPTDNVANMEKIPTNWRDVRYGRIELLQPWFPEVDPTHKTFRSRRSRRKAMLLTALATSSTVLLTNLVALIVLEVTYKAERGVVPMYEGSCSLVKSLDIVAHLFINILSTVLLGASNLCMQLLAAPTRKEVDKAHSQQTWLDIGVPSFRNLFSIKRSRVVLWVLLALSSMPLHFVYNSVISSSIPGYEYATAVVSENFLRGAPFGNGFVSNSQINATITPGPWNGSGTFAYEWPPLNVWNRTSALLSWPTLAMDPTKFSNMSNSDCLDLYTNNFAHRTNLIVVVQEFPEDANASVHEFSYQYTSVHSAGMWPCGDVNASLGEISCAPPANARQWNKFNRMVLYCLSEIPPAGDHCRLNYSPNILIAICMFSTVKCFCIGFLAIRYREHTLTTIGDAICSFLKTPDKTTTHMGFVTKATASGASSRMWTSSSTCRAQSRRIRLYSAASTKRWILTVSLGLIAVVAATVMLGTGAKGTTQRATYKTFTWQLRQPLGTADPSMFTGYELPRYGMPAFISAVLWANMFQVIVSGLYFAFNALLTCMLVAEEWSGYAKDRKTLRVSHPEGIQRGSYFVSMPFKYGVPFMSLITTLHWLISQSIFPISVTALYPSYTEDTSLSYCIVGYSTSASFAATIFGLCCVIIVVLFSLRRLPLSNMPLAATSSVAISAACHHPDEDVDAHLLPVKWGIITQETPARTAFTTLRDVRPPRENEEIVGFEEDKTDIGRASRDISNVMRRLTKLLRMQKKEE